MLRFLTTLFCTWLSVTSLYASPPDIAFGKISQDEIEMRFYPLDSSAHAVVLGDYGHSRFVYHVQKGIQLVYTRHTRIKILNAQGYDWATVEIPLYHDGTSQEEVTQIKGFTYNLQGEKIEKEKLKNDGKFREKLDEDWEVVKFTMPNVREGSVIEYTYTITSDFLFNLQDWEFQKSIPVVWSEYEVQIPEYFYYKQVLQGYHPLVINEQNSGNAFFTITQRERTGGGDFSSPVQSKVTNHRIDFTTTTYRWAAEAVPALTEEPYLTTLDDYIMKITFELASTRFPGEPVRNYTNTWEKIDEELLADESFGKVLKRGNSVKHQVETLTKGMATPEEQMLSIYSYVRDHIQWDGHHTLAARQSLKQTLENQSGNVADINLLLTALLREAGIVADPVVLSTRSHGVLRKSFPMLQQFNYVITRAMIGDNQFLLDGTEAACPANLLPVRCLNGEGRLVNEAMGEKWISLVPKTAAYSFSMVSLQLDQTLHWVGKVTNAANPYDALRLRHEIKADHDQAHYLEKNGKLQGWKVNHYALQDVDNLNKPVKEEYEVELTGQYMEAGELVYLNTVLTGQLAENPFKLENRTYPVDFAYPYQMTYILNLMLPEDYVLEETPEDVFIALPDHGGMYSYQVKSTGNMVQVLSKLEISRSRFMAEEYPYLREFFDKLVAKQKEQLVLRKNKKI